MMCRHCRAYCCRYLHITEYVFKNWKTMSAQCQHILRLSI